jgi:DNA-directed RNA polymerase subunit beta'
MVKAGEMLDEDTIDELEAAGVDEVKVRTALTCETRFGIVPSAMVVTWAVAA